MTDQQIKAAVRKRDGHKCVKCGIPNAVHIVKYGTQLEVHRVVPGSDYGTGKNVCVTLCRPCHAAQPRRSRGDGEHLNVKLPPAINKALKAYAKRERRTISTSALVLIELMLAAHGYMISDIDPKLMFKKPSGPDHYCI